MSKFVIIILALIVMAMCSPNLIQKSEPKAKPVDLRLVDKITKVC